METQPRVLRVAFAMPTYGPIDPQAAHAVRSALIGARAINFAYDVTVDRIRTDHARNLLIRAVIDRDVDGVLWCDSDSVPKPDSFLRLIVGAVQRKLDMVSGLCHKREIYKNGHQLWEVYKDPKHELTDEEADASPLVELDWCGFGITWTSIGLLRAAQAESNKRVWTGPFAFTEFRPEDQGFCYLARELGFRVWADTTVRIGHVGYARIIE